LSGGMLPVRTVDRIVVLLTGILLTALIIAFAWQAIGWNDTFDRIYRFLSQSGWRKAITILIFLGLICYLFWMGLRRRTPEKTIQCETPLGEVLIAERAIESLALRAARKVKGVRDANINVRATTSGLDITIMTTVVPDQNMPQLSQEIRTKVGEYIREIVGVSVNSVTVNVSRIAAENRARVE